MEERVTERRNPATGFWIFPNQLPPTTFFMESMKSI
jgi:hypothetical protein